MLLKAQNIVKFFYFPDFFFYSCEWSVSRRRDIVACLGMTGGVLRYLS